MCGFTADGPLLACEVGINESRDYRAIWRRSQQYAICWQERKALRLTVQSTEEEPTLIWPSFGCAGEKDRPLEFKHLIAFRHFGRGRFVTSHLHPQ